MSCTCSRTCLKGAVVVGLIAALTPGLWTQTLAQQRTTPEGQTIAPGVPAEAQQTATARGTTLGARFSPRIRTDTLPTAPAQGGRMRFTNQAAFSNQGGCTIFDNKAEFEAFNAGEGKVLKGIEFFEETPPDTPIVGFPDPLCGGIPNGPFFSGLDQLNLCVQANTLGGAAVVPSPHGPDGLVLVPFGAGFGENSDLVLANSFADSFDIMFDSPPVPPDQHDNHTGVGFDAVSIFGGGFVQIEVYGKNNELMAAAIAPADPRGVFWGVSCPNTIGRINVFDTGGGAQGADNIQMWKAGRGGLCGDANCDGVLDAADINPFFLALTDPVAWQKQFPDCDILDLDINGDGLFNNFDIDPFFIALGGGGCP